MLPLLPPPYSWLLAVGFSGLVVGTSVVLWYMARFYRRRQDVRYFPWAFAGLIFYVAAPVITNVATIISLFRPIVELEVSLIFGRGVITLLTASLVILIYPKVLRIPTRAQIEEEHSLFVLRDTIALEGRITSENGVMISANPAAVKIYGYASQEELIHVPIRELIHPDDYQKVIESMRQEVSEMYECRGKSKNGETLYLRVRGRTIRRGGQTQRLSSVQDITKETLLALKLKEDVEHTLVRLETKETAERIKEKLGRPINEE